MAKKKIGVVPISIFDVLDKIREDHTITNKQWSDASGLSESRISEFRNRKPHRVFTMDKAYVLSAAIRQLTRRDILRKDMQNRIDEVESYREKAILLLLLGFKDDNDPRIKHIYENMKLLSQGNSDDK